MYVGYLSYMSYVSYKSISVNSLRLLEIACKKTLLIYDINYKNENIERKVLRSSRPDVFLKKGALKICSKFTGYLLCNFIEIALQNGCSPVNLLHIFRTPFPKNTSGWLLLEICKSTNF